MESISGVNEMVCDVRKGVPFDAGARAAARAPPARIDRAAQPIAQKKIKN